MRLTVLGCSGGFGAGLRTTALLVDHDVLIDAGTGVGDLSVAQLARIDHVFVSHSHLDHICSIPFLADTVGALRGKPLVVHAPEETIDALRRHLFNGVLWPDFTRLPAPEAPYLRLEAVAPGQPISLDGRRFAALPASHAVPAVGYWLDSGAASLVYTGDTGPNPALWEAVNAIANLEHLIIETAFCDREVALALLARHLCPRLLARELAQLTRPAHVHITHLKPADSDITMREIAQVAGQYHPQRLRHGQVIDF
jgi:ribonuclease BN (tRNA processing enzyme)